MKCDDFRAIFVMFLVEQIDGGGLALSRSDAIEYYVSFTAMVYLLSLLGGLISDLLLGAFKSSVLGLLVMGIGLFAFSSVVDASNYKIAGGIIALGSGLFKPSIFTLIAQQLYKMPQRMDSAFMAQYLMINLGAFLSGILMGEIIGSSSYKYGFVACGFVCLFTVFLCFMNKKHLQPEAPLLQFDVPGASSISRGAMIGGVITALLWLKFNIHSWLKIALSFVLMAVGWFILTRLGNDSVDIGQTLILVAILHSVAEIFFTPMLMSLIGRYGYRPLMATSFAVFSAVAVVGNWITKKLHDMPFEFAHFGLISLALVAIIGGGWTVYSKKRTPATL